MNETFGRMRKRRGNKIRSGRGIRNCRMMDRLYSIDWVIVHASGQTGKASSDQGDSRGRQHAPPLGEDRRVLLDHQQLQQREKQHLQYTARDADADFPTSPSVSSRKTAPAGIPGERQRLLKPLLPAPRTAEAAGMNGKTPQPPFLHAASARPGAPANRFALITGNRLPDAYHLRLRKNGFAIHAAIIYKQAVCTIKSQFRPDFIAGNAI